MKSLKFASRCHCLSDTIGFIHPPFGQSFHYPNVSAFSSALTKMILPKNPAFFPTINWYIKHDFRPIKPLGSPHWPARGLIVESAAKRAFLTKSSCWRFRKMKKKTGLIYYFPNKTGFLPNKDWINTCRSKQQSAKSIQKKEKSGHWGPGLFSPS